MSTPRLLVVGPLPPPYNGTSVSFRVFLDELERRPDRLRVVVIDSAPKRLKDRSTLFTLGNLTTALRIVGRFLRHAWGADAILLFGSNQFLLTMAGPLALVGRALGKPAWLRAFGGSLDVYHSRLSPPARRLFDFLLRRSSGLIVQTRLLEEHFRPLLGARVRLVPGYRRVAPPETPPREGQGLRLAFVGHVREEKGIFTLLAAMRRLAEQGDASTTCTLYGPVLPSAEARFEEELARTPNASHGGILEPDAVVPTLAGHDALVFPSHYVGEGHPGVVLEAMTAGLPVVTTDFRSIPELVEDGVNGLLVPPEDPAALAGALRRLAEDPQLRERLADGSRASRDRHSAEEVVPLLLEPLGLELGAGEG